MTSAKDVKDLLTRARARGWVHLGLDGRGHHRLRWPDSGEELSIAATPRQATTLANDEARLTRISGPLRPKPGAGQSKSARAARRRRALDQQSQARSRRGRQQRKRTPPQPPEPAEWQQRLQAWRSAHWGDPALRATLVKALADVLLVTFTQVGTHGRPIVLMPGRNGSTVIAGAIDPQQIAHSVLTAVFDARPADDGSTAGKQRHHQLQAWSAAAWSDSTRRSTLAPALGTALVAALRSAGRHTSAVIRPDGATRFVILGAYDLEAVADHLLVTLCEAPSGDITAPSAAFAS
ncbi:hypothetical protein [Nocardia transvalensis]|uniref:hypothetical protein n=1 Tax=Nocardia transvalensis TaxID=37333 RepID=UPI0018940C7F|nr:hypothetical protein [Nocardia transvalensis]MBF6333525.1 hypothetical protein [Nocardia transvalensis]